LTATGSFSAATERNFLGAVYNDHIRTVRVAADYQRQDDLGGWNYLTVGVRQGLDLLGASHQGDAFLSTNGTALASIVDVSFRAIIREGRDRRPTGLHHAAAITGILSRRSGIRPRLGGEVSGDNGIAGRARASLRSFPHLRLAHGLPALRLRRPGHGLERRLRGRSYLTVFDRAGLRLHFPAEMEADAGIAVPLDYRALDNESRAPHVYFSLSKSFKLCPDRTRLHCT